MTSVVALGDSFTCGEGVGVRVPPSATWVAQLAAGLPDGRLRSLAVPGARVADVRRGQLPLLTRRADVATLLIGLNDVARAGFDAGAVRTDLLEVVASLRERADDVVLGRLHDPTAVLWVPARFARAIRERIAVVNGAVDEAARSSRVHVLDLARIPELGCRGGWAVDRVHPSPVGHQGLASAAASCLAAGGRHRPRPPARILVPPGPSRAARSWWMARHGLPYVAAHSRDIAAPLGSVLLFRR